MVLHGLGKVSATLAEHSSGEPAMIRTALTMYSAALVACPSNHLAANELGVLLVRDGRAAEAARLFERTIDMAPTATAYHNLSVARKAWLPRPGRRQRTGIATLGGDRAGRWHGLEAGRRRMGIA